MLMELFAFQDMVRLLPRRPLRPLHGVGAQVNNIGRRGRRSSLMPHICLKGVSANNLCYKKTYSGSTIIFRGCLASNWGNNLLRESRPSITKGFKIMRAEVETLSSSANSS